MAIQITAFRWVPSFAQGYVKDLRVRWALEEAGLPYEAVLLDLPTPGDYREWQPFGQVPAYRDDEVEIFASDTIVLHIADRSPALTPGDARGRARVTSWVIAALNSVEPHAQNFIHLDAFRAGDIGAQQHRLQLEATLKQRLSALSTWLGGRDHLEDRFTAGDLVMTTVLRELVDCGVLSQFPALDAYRCRCEARPAFGRALEFHLQPFRENAPGRQATDR